MDYNKFAYYRANPYAAQGFMPPIAYINRHSNEYAVQLPQGEEHLAKIGKRMFYQHHQASNIQNMHLLESPERYPYENRIAMDKSYERNMNTIDIEGASSGTLLSQAVRNKFRGREALIKKQKEANGVSPLEHLEELQRTEQQRRREIAYQQYLKNEKMNKLISKKASINYEEERQMGHQSNILPRRIQERYRGDSLPQKMQYGQKEQRKDQKQQWQGQSLSRALEQHNMSHGNVPNKRLFQSIDVSRIPQNPELGFEKQRKSLGSTQMSQSQVMFEPEEYRVPLVIDPKTLRKQSPTNLSSINGARRS